MPFILFIITINIYSAHNINNFVKKVLYINLYHALSFGYIIGILEFTKIHAFFLNNAA